MRKQSTLIFNLLLLVGDFVAVLSAFVIAYIVRVKLDARPLVQPIAARTYLEIFLLLIPFWLVIFSSLGLYKKEMWNSWLRETWLLFVGSFAGILFVIGYDFVVLTPVFPARSVAAYALALGFVILVFERTLQRLFRKVLLSFGVGKLRVMLVGDGASTKELAETLMNHPLSGYHVSAIVASRRYLPEEFEGKHFLSLDAGLAALEGLSIESIIQTQLSPRKKDNESIVAETTRLHMEYRFVPEQSTALTAHSELELFAGFPMLTLHPTKLIGWGQITKRIFDIAASSLALLILSPLLLVLAVLIKILDPGPVFFRQKRLTRFGNEATVIKFRSVKTAYSGRDPDEVFRELGRPELIKEFEENRAKVSDDPRISRFGAWLRRWSLDELPQLLNILSGKLSLVGPRAIPGNELKFFEDRGPLVLKVKTGITGLAQVSGRSDISLDERLQLDLYYVQNWSIWMDIKILFRTIGVVLGRKGTA